MDAWMLRTRCGARIVPRPALTDNNNAASASPFPKLAVKVCRLEDGKVPGPAARSTGATGFEREEVMGRKRDDEPRVGANRGGG